MSVLRLSALRDGVLDVDGGVVRTRRVATANGLDGSVTELLPRTPQVVAENGKALPTAGKRDH
ncbi:MAG: hypothetical protein QOG53_319 [Frankiales bacterium]|nr:hypothetical protein [Frankiales bacterium]